MNHFQKGCDYNDLQARFACLRCAACGHYVSAESPCVFLELLNNLNNSGNFLVYKYCKRRLANNFSYESENSIIFEINSTKKPIQQLEAGL